MQISWGVRVWCRIGVQKDAGIPGTSFRFFKICIDVKIVVHIQHYLRGGTDLRIFSLLRNANRASIALCMDRTKLP
jgi:hypothetical protein